MEHLSHLPGRQVSVPEQIPPGTYSILMRGAKDEPASASRHVTMWACDRKLSAQTHTTVRAFGAGCSTGMRDLIQDIDFRLLCFFIVQVVLDLLPDWLLHGKVPSSLRIPRRNLPPVKTAASATAMRPTTSTLTQATYEWPAQLLPSTSAAPPVLPALLAAAHLALRRPGPLEARAGVCFPTRHLRRAWVERRIWGGACLGVGIPSRRPDIPVPSACRASQR